MWHGIHGHDDVVERFRRTIARGRLAHTYLLVGPSGIGKRRFALELARALLCTATADADLEACGGCDSCRLFAAGNHPDLEVVGLPADKATLPIALFIGTKERRNQEGLCHNIALKPFLGRRKIAIVDDADYFGLESANCLLKTLEEPPERSLILLIGTSPARQLPTIRSRAQLVRFRPLEPAVVEQVLLENGLAGDAHQAARMAAHAEGSIERAVALSDPALWEFRGQLFEDLSARRPDSARMARAVQAFVDEAGSEAAAKRDRLRTVVSFALDFYRQEFAVVASGRVRPEAALRASGCCLDTLEHVDRNANLGLVIQRWCESLTDVAAGRA